MKGRYRAIAVIEGEGNAPNLEGTVIFTETHFGVHVEAQVSGLPENDTGFYGFHLHEGDSCVPPDFKSAGGHYNPEGLPHPLHAGDFPMLIATDSGEAWLTFITTRFEVRDIIGKTVIVHGDRDDYTSQPAGDAGERIGCGVVELF
ncbi:MAG: superoxide dismutase family protein [Christensenellales bacterium]